MSARTTPHEDPRRIIGRFERVIAELDHTHGIHWPDDPPYDAADIYHLTRSRLLKSQATVLLREARIELEKYRDRHPWPPASAPDEANDPLADDPLTQALVSLAEGRPGRLLSETATDTLRLLDERVPEDRRPFDWPQSARLLRVRLNERVPDLEAAGHTIAFPRKGNGRVIAFRPASALTATAEGH